MAQQHSKHEIVLCSEVFSINSLPDFLLLCLHTCQDLIPPQLGYFDLA